LLGVNFRELDQMFDLKVLALRNPACLVRFSLHLDDPLLRQHERALRVRVPELHTKIATSIKSVGLRH
ncbi:hypothetical protein, partial [Mesorhizobium sp. M7A.F.Ca.US.014.04.1.1]|uniref:hypothetical protein n=1 Tax=Mesorhizobium sp. M7A.F.Ca.US.014.04.1.1 TaxID=2496744 RepID=UPI0019D257DB